MKRSGITTAWIILSLASAIITWVILYMVYIFVFPGYVLTANTILGQFGTTYPQLNAIAGNITSQANAAFVLIAVGVFFFMLVSPYIFEPISGGSESY